MPCTGKGTLPRIMGQLKAKRDHLVFPGFASRFKHPPALVSKLIEPKKNTPKGGPSQGGNARKGLWDQAAACSIGEKGNPRLSATAL